MSDLEIIGFDRFWIKFRLNQHHFLCCAGYRPPYNDHLNSINVFFSNFQISLDKIHDLPRDFNLIIVGDFNTHNVNYPQKSTDIGTQFNSFLERKKGYIFFVLV